MIYLIQLLLLLTAFYLGRHDAPAADQFSNFGSNKKQQRLFHNTNWKAKLFISLIGLLPFTGLKWYYLLLVITIYTCIMWPVFNVSINLARKIPVRTWDYISSGSNSTDILLLEIFGKKAGKILVLSCTVVITIFNILLYKLCYKTHIEYFTLNF